MVFYTTETINGRYPSEYIGLVHGLGISTEGGFATAVNSANTQIEEGTRNSGGDAVVAIRYETTTIGRNVFVHVYGTAVKE